MNLVQLLTIVILTIFINCVSLQKLSSINLVYQFYTNEDDRSCLFKNPDRLLYSSSSTKCQLNCSWFSSSSPEYNDYYNDNENLIYNLNENKVCAIDSYCRSGSCTHLNNILGRAKLTVGQCFLPGFDPIPLTDAYIKVWINSNYSGRRHIGNTNAIIDNNWPVFNAVFDSPLVSFDGHFYISIYDRDLRNDDFIVSTTLKFTDCLSESSFCIRYLKISGYSGNFYMKYKISWEPSS